MPAWLARGVERVYALSRRVGPLASILLGVSAVSLIWLGTLYNMSTDYEQTELAALQNSENLVRAFEEQFIRTIRAVDQTLIYVRDAYSKNPAQFDISLWSKNTQFLTDFTFQISILDKDGWLVTGNIGTQAKVDLSDREHFKVHKLRDTDELFISKPVLGRVSGKWSIQLTRRISNPDGSFGGVVVVSLDAVYLSRLYNSIDLGQKGWISLIGTDGIVRAHAIETAIGQSMADGTLFQLLKQAPAGHYEETSAIDGVDRILTYRAIRGYPLIVELGMARKEVFARYRRNRQNSLAIAGGLSALLIPLVGFVFRYQNSLAKARDAAEAGIQARTRFLAVMSHEIRTPMNAVLGFASTLLDTKLDADQRGSVVAIHEAGDHLLRIVNDILDFSRLDAGRFELEAIPFSPGAVVSNALSIIKPRAVSKGLTLRTEIDPELPAALIGDAGGLRQVLINLLSNAVKFTNAGEICVRARRIAEVDGYATIECAVKDSGIGIPEDQIKNLFSEFVQADSSINRRFGGSGLGLAICKRMIEQMGGEITVTSAPKQGSTFTFRMKLPIAKDLVDASTADDDTPHQLEAAIATLGRPLRVLIVDDNPTNQLVTSKMLQNFTMTITVASDGAEAVKLVLREPFDVVLMDMQMPEMNGIEATTAIRAHGGSLATLPIIALTANAYADDVKACLNAGMNDFLAKPVRKKLLVERILRMCPGVRADAPTISSPSIAPAGTTIAEDHATNVVDQATIEVLRQELGSDCVSATIRVFLTETDKRLVLLKQLSCDRDRDTIKSEAHTLKGASGTVGLPRLAKLALKLEKSAPDITENDYQALVCELEEAFGSARLQLQAYLVEPAVS